MVLLSNTMLSEAAEHLINVNGVLRRSCSVRINVNGKFYRPEYQCFTKIVPFLILLQGFQVSTNNHTPPAWGNFYGKRKAA